MTQQNRNRSIVRSHVMRAIRRSQRQKKNQLRPKPIELSSGAKVKGSDKALDVPTGSSSMTLPVRQAEHQLQSRAALANQVLSRSTWATNSAKLSLPSMMESILGPSTIYQGKVTPLFHQLIEFCKVKKLHSLGRELMRIKQTTPRYCRRGGRAREPMNRLRWRWTCSR